MRVNCNCNISQAVKWKPRKIEKKTENWPPFYAALRSHLEREAVQKGETVCPIIGQGSGNYCMTHHFPDTRHAVSQCSFHEWIVSTGLDPVPQRVRFPARQRESAFNETGLDLLDVSGEGGKRFATLVNRATRMRTFVL